MQGINIGETIKERVDAVEAIGRYVQLKRMGKNWVGLCPFHSEKTGSFVVYEESGWFVCFGCDAKGDLIDFYKRHFNLEFLDACERICEEYNIPFERGGGYSKDKNKDALYDVNAFAGKLYYEAIKEEGNPALEYLLGRGIDRGTISKFRIGFADASGRMLSEKLEGDEAKQKAAKEVGLIYEHSGRFRDKFFSRVIFPIVNTRKKVIGFGGRDISGNPKAAKYINSDASGAYAKGTNLYGLAVTQEKIREKRFGILVEGYMDVVALYMHGVTNVCAVCGTALTQQQAKLLSRYTKNVVLAFDSDGAGQNAALKNMDILAPEGLKVKVLVLEGAKDPDEFIRTFGREAFDRAVQAAVPMYDYKLAAIKGVYDIDTSDGRVDYLKAAAAVIAPLSPVERDVYKKKLAVETGVSEEALEMQMGGSGGEGQWIPSSRKGRVPRNDDGASKGRPPAAGRNRPLLAREELLGGVLLLALGSGYVLEKAAVYRYLFDGSEYGGVFTAMLLYKERTGAAPNAEELSELLDETDQAVLDVVVRKISGGLAVTDEEQIDEYLMKLDLSVLKEREAELKEGANNSVGGGDTEVLMDLMGIQKRIKALENDIRNGRRGE